MTAYQAPYQDRHYQSRDGLKLYFRDYPADSPDALTILCIPGLTRNSADFHDLATHLAGRYRVLAADLRGRGRSAYAADAATYVPVQYVQDMQALLKHAGVKRAVFIGTSLGGIVTMLMAGISRNLLAGAVINDVGPVIDAAGLQRIGAYVGKVPPQPSWADAARAVRAANGHAFPDYGEADWNAFARRTYTERDGMIVPDYDPRIAEAFGKSAVGGADLWPFFDALTGLPLLTVRGETSDILAAETLAAMVRRNPAMAAVTLPRIGHAPFLTAPPALAAIEALLARVPRRLNLLRRIKARIDAFRHAGRVIKAMRQPAPAGQAK